MAVQTYKWFTGPSLDTQQSIQFLDSSDNAQELQIKCTQKAYDFFAQHAFSSSFLTWVEPADNPEARVATCSRKDAYLVQALETLFLLEQKIKARFEQWRPALLRLQSAPSDYQGIMSYLDQKLSESFLINSPFTEAYVAFDNQLYIYNVQGMYRNTLLREHPDFSLLWNSLHDKSVVPKDNVVVDIGGSKQAYQTFTQQVFQPAISDAYCEMIRLVCLEQDTLKRATYRKFLEMCNDVVRQFIEDRLDKNALSACRKRLGETFIPNKAFKIAVASVLAGVAGFSGGLMLGATFTMGTEVFLTALFTGIVSFNVATAFAMGGAIGLGLLAAFLTSYLINHRANHFKSKDPVNKAHETIVDTLEARFEFFENSEPVGMLAACKR